jgi:CLIP-associating protein 1/2
MDGEDDILKAIASLELATLAEKRVTGLQALEASLERSNDIYSHSEEVTGALRTQLKHANPLVAAKALSVLPTFVDRLTIDSSDVRRATYSLRQVISAFVPLMTERLGDHRERTREGADKVLTQLAAAASKLCEQHAIAKPRPTEDTPLSVLEMSLVEHGLRSKVAKTREVVTLILPKLRREAPRLHLRPFMSTLVDNLADADAGVRESARSAIVTLFASASPIAKTELKKELDRKAVRRATQDSIIAQIFDDAGHIDREPAYASGRQTPISAPMHQHVSHDDGSSIPARSASRSGNNATAATSTIAAPDVRPFYVASAFELDKLFASFLPLFDGKESEHNWQAREHSIVKMRGMLKTSVQDHLGTSFQAGILRMAESILKGVASLRTTLCLHGITLVTELSQSCGDDLGGAAETFFTALLRMAGFTKKIVATASQAAVHEILSNTSYKAKYMEQLSQSLKEKNPVTRLAVSQHFITILNVHARYRKHALEAHGGTEMITTMCKRALTDANKDVRALGRQAFYRVEEIWPTIGAIVVSSLDPASLKLVENNRTANGQSAFSNEVPAMRKSIVPERPSSRLATATPPRTPRTPANRSGPSNALLTAKRAAAARMAEQRRREEAEAAAKVGEDGEDMSRETAASSREGPRAKDSIKAEDEDIMSEEEVLDEELEEQRRFSPPPSQRRSAVRSTPTASVTPSKPQRQTTPSSTHPSSIPLPVSPSSNSSSLKRPSSMLLLASRPRTNSTSSVSSNRSVGRLNLAANGQYGSIAQRFEQSPSQTAAAAREARNSSSRTQTPSRSFRATPGSSISRLQPSLAQPSAALGSSTRGVHRDDVSEVTVDADLASSFDASVYLNTPAHLGKGYSIVTPASAASAMSRSATDDNLHSRAFVSPAGSTASASAQRRGRPMSMIPSPRTPSVALPRLVKASSDDKSPGVDAAKRAAIASHRAQIPADASRGLKWFLGKASRLDSTPSDDVGNANSQLSPVKRRPESGDNIAQLAGGRATLLTFKNLVALSKDFKLPDRPRNDTMLEFDDYEEARRISSANAMAKFEYDLAIAMWQEESLFDRLFAAISSYLQQPPPGLNDRDLQTAALVLLHRVVDNQFGLFATSGREGELFALLLHVIQRNANASATTMADVKNACQVISDRWCKQTDVVMGISVVRLALSPLLTSTDAVQADAATLPSEPTAAVSSSLTAAMQVLAFKALAQLFERLPAEVVEEQMEHCKEFVRFGLNHRQIDVRQQAVKVIVSANTVLRDPQSIFGILQPIDKAQQDLLIYYMSKS